MLWRSSSEKHLPWLCHPYATYLVLHPKYLEYIAKLEEEYVRMTERTQRV